MSESIDFKQVGSRPIRPDGVDKVTGRATFGADLNMSGMLYGHLLRSPHAHARIKNIDYSAAEKIPGVFAVITGEHFPEISAGTQLGGEGAADVRDVAHNVMARDKVLYHGHAVAAVAASTSQIAEQAIAAIRVDYEELTPVMNLEAAMAPDAPLIQNDLYTRGLAETPDKPSNIASRMELKGGDVEEGFAQADCIVEGEYRTPTIHQGYIEPHACIARIGEDDQTMIWCSTQGHFVVRAAVAKILAIDISRIRVMPSEIGGGFGGKTTVYLEPVAVLLARLSSRPVKMVMTREEVFRASGPASACLARVRIGAKACGTITAMKAWLAYEAGAFAGSPAAPGAMCIFTPYITPNFYVESYDVLVNKPKVAAYRAPGAPQSMYAGESLMDELARKLDMDPLELRLKNAVDEGSRAVYGPKFRAIGLKSCLEAARTHPNYKKAVQADCGLGVAVGFWFNVGMQSSASVQVNEDGSVTVIEGNPDIGGSRASMALMAAEELGISYEKVRVMVADTDNVGISDVTGGSRVTYATGMAVIEAARKVKQDLCERAANLWNIDATLVSWKDGAAVAQDGVNDELKPLSLAEIAAKAPKTGGPIGQQASLNARGAGPSFP